MKVCANCFNDKELKLFIISNTAENGKCDYCNDDSITAILDISELLDFFAEFFQVFKLDPAGIPLA